MKTYLLSGFEIVVNENNVVTFARSLLTGKFIKHSFAYDLLNNYFHENDCIVLDVMFNSITFILCSMLIMFLAQLSVVENTIILMVLIVLKMINETSLNVYNLINKQWSI